MKAITVTLVFEQDKNGGFSAYVAEEPGVNSQGDTFEEAAEWLFESYMEMLAHRREKALKPK